MLYDNAQLIELMTESWRESKSKLFAQRIEETVDWLLREMVVPGGGFAASLDADSEGEEGKFYVWSLAEIRGNSRRGCIRKFFAEIYGVTAAGQFRRPQYSQPARFHRASRRGRPSAVSPRCARSCSRGALRASGPGFDDKVLADWNGLMIAALAKAAEAFDKPQWLAAAEAAFDFVSTKMISNGRLLHAYRAGEAKAPATANDYANMIRAALALANVTGKRAYVDRAREWADMLDKHYWASDIGGYYFVADDTSDLIVRPLKRTGRGDAERERHDGVESHGALSLDRRGALSRARRGGAEGLRRRDAAERAGACRPARRRARCDRACSHRADRARGWRCARVARARSATCRCRARWCRR